MDEDVEAVEEKARIVRQVFTNLGIEAQIENLNAVDAWMGSIPGNVGHYLRKPLISTGNLVHMMPICDVWAGPERNNHLKAPALLYTQTVGSTPFRLSLHIGDVGHTLVIGPTGAGKSVFLNLIEAQFRKYKDAQIFVFDKGGSSRILTEGVGGIFYDLGNESRGLSFQPLSGVDDENERQWALEWLCDYVRAENLKIDPQQKKLIWDALSMLGKVPKKFRSISGFINNLQDRDLKIAFSPLSIKGAYG
ncbi:MAG: conjugal transfer protein TrbE, partial [Schwartzia sp.]|nr:conjugal transfer protein TrbE [Schwartzia sp. (in: firmicutes)]